MADRALQVPENVAGSFFVDSTCIDCDTCRQLAPATFGEADAYSFVQMQPRDAEETRAAFRALVACPTASIGADDKRAAAQAVQDFPLPIEDGVYYCGFNAESSFGANSYFIQHPEGNWLVDSPRHLPFLVKKFEALGGLKYIFLTHRDDVADADKYAKHFGAKRIIHQADTSALPDAEVRLAGEDPVPFGKDFLVIPTPGHTRGHCVLLYRDRYLFTGDHLAYSRQKKHLVAFRNANWYSWPETVRSMEKLQNFSFEWILTGHGQRIHLPEEQMRTEMAKVVTWMRSR